MVGWSRRGFRFLSFLFLMASLVTPFSPAQALRQESPPTGGLTIALVDDTGVPVAGGTFEIATAAGTWSATDESGTGTLSLVDIAPGPVTVTHLAGPDGYTTGASTTIDITAETTSTATLHTSLIPEAVSDNTTAKETTETVETTDPAETEEPTNPADACAFAESGDSGCEDADEVTDPDSACIGAGCDEPEVPATATAPTNDAGERPAPENRGETTGGVGLPAFSLQSNTLSNSGDEWAINDVILTVTPPASSSIDNKGAGDQFEFGVRLENNGSPGWFIVLLDTDPPLPLIDSDISMFDSRSASVNWQITDADVAAGQITVPGIIVTDGDGNTLGSTDALTFPFTPAVTTTPITLDETGITQPSCDGGYQPPRLAVPPSTESVSYSHSPEKDVYVPGDVATVQATWDATLYHVTEPGTWDVSTDIPGLATQTVTFADVPCEIAGLLVEIVEYPASYSFVTDTISYKARITNIGASPITDITVAGGDSSIERLEPGGHGEMTSGWRPLTEEDLTEGGGITLSVTINGMAEGSGNTVSATSSEITIPYAAPVGIALDVDIDALIIQGTCADNGTLAPPTITLPDNLTDIRLSVSPAAPYAPGQSVTVKAETMGARYFSSAPEGWEIEEGRPTSATHEVVFDDVPCGDPAITVTKSASRDTYSVEGDVIEFQVAIENTGDRTLTNLVIVDDLTGDRWELDQLRPRESANWATSLSVSAESIGEGASITNTASVTAQVALAEDNDEPVTGSDSVTITWLAPTTVTPETVVFTQATCPNYSPPTVRLPDNTDTVAYATSASSDAGAFFPGQRVVVTATAASGLIFVDPLPAGWEPVKPNKAEFAITFEEVPCAPAGLSVTKSVSNEQATWSADETVSYTIVIHNERNVPLTDVAVTDAMVRDLACEGATTETPHIIPSLDVGGTVTCTATYTVSQDDIDRGSDLTNTASASGTMPFGATVSGSDSVAISVVPAAPAIGIETTVVDKQLEYDRGDTISYEITVTNSGNVSLSGIVVTGDLADDLACDGNAIAPDEEIACTASYTVGQPDIDAGHPIVHTVSVTGIAPDGVTKPSATDSADVDVVPALPGLSLGVSANPTRVNAAGQEVDLTFTVTNSGNVTLTNISINDLLLTPASRPVTCQATTLAPNTSTECTATFIVDQARLNAGGTADSIPMASGTTPDNGSVSSSRASAVITLVREPGITLDTIVTNVRSGPTDRAITPGEPVRDLVPGDVVTYQITATNTGNVTLLDGVVSETGLDTLTCVQPATLQPGEALTCTGTYTLVDDDTARWTGITNSTHVNAMTAASENIPASASITIWPAVPDPILTLTKNADSATYDSVGDVIGYTLTIRNTGTVPVHNLTVSDPGADEALDCELPEILEVDASASCTGSHTVVQVDLDAGSYTNDARVTGMGPDDKTTQATDSVTANAVQTPNFDFTNIISHVNGTAVTGPVANLEANDVVTYTLVATNRGNVTLEQVTIADSRIDVAAPDCAQPASIAPGSALTCTTTYTVTQDDIDLGATIANPATASATAPDATILQRDASVSANVVAAAAEMKLEKSVSPDIIHRAGETVTWSFAVTNTGNVTITDVEIADPTLYDRGGGTVTCPETTVAPGTTITCTASMIITQAAVDHGVPLVNEATASGLAPERVMTRKAIANPRLVTSAPSRATMTVAQAPALTLVIRASTPPGETIGVGTKVTWDYTVTNSGNITLKDVVVMDDYIGSTSHGGSGLPGLSTLGPGESRTVSGTSTITAKHLETGSVSTIAWSNSGFIRSPDTTFTLRLENVEQPTETPSQTPTDPSNPATPSETPTSTPTNPAEESATETPTSTPTQTPASDPNPDAPESTSTPADTVTPDPTGTLASSPPGTPATGEEGSGEEHIALEPTPPVITGLPSTGQAGPGITTPAWTAVTLAALVLVVMAAQLQRRNRT